MSALNERFAAYSVPKMIMMGFVLGAAYYFFAFDKSEKVEKEIAQVEQETATIVKQIQATQRVVADIKKFEQEVNTISDQFRAALEFLPNKLDIQDILRNITNEAKRAGVNVASVLPKNPEKKDFYEEILMEVELTGTYPQITLFLSYISSIKRIINIRNIEMVVTKTVDNTPILSLKGTLVGYRYLEGK